MKVAQISPTFLGETSVIGGAERFALELSRSLAHTVSTTLITFSGREKHFSLEREGDLEIRKYPVRRFVGGNVANPFTIAFLKHLRSFDVLHCHGYPKAVTDLCILFASIFRKALVITDHHGGGICASTYLSKLGIDTRSLVDRFLLLSPSNASQYRAYRDRVRIIGAGVDTSRFRPIQCPRELRILFVGRIVPVKGIEYLIDAVEPTTPVRVIGPRYDDAYFRELEKKALGKAVQFLPQMGDLDLVGEYCSALVTVVPSVHKDMFGMPTSGELLPLVPLESMACGTPVIGTRSGGLPEIVEDGVSGFIVPPSDVQALQERIRFFLDRPDIARRMGEAGRQRVLQDFSWEGVAERCVAAYDELLKR